MSTQENMTPRRHKLFYGSSPDRGLEMLLYIWPDIKKVYPDAELHFCYGWKLFDMLARTNPERRQWKASVQIMLQHPGVTDHGRLGKEDLAKVRKSCGIWSYPSYFTEINCITALDSQKDGLVPVTISLAALKETVGAGVLVKGNIKDPKVMKTYLKELLAIMGDEKRWQVESEKGKKFASNFTWDKIAKEWVKEFQAPISTPKVSVITLTIREGFWNIMADNLNRQTYKNFEWIIVDDYKEDRSSVAKDYATRYNLDIRYLRGGYGSKHHRRCGLVRANNISWQNAKGELLVYLQDFILMPFDGIERLVDIYRHHLNDLIAPVDIYYEALPADKKDKEDWWNGKTKILTKKAWTNVRVQNLGMRYSDNPFDFEMDYGAIPKKLLVKLNGFWEFFDEGLGYDNYEIAYRALSTGSRLIVDDTNIAKCINIWPIVMGTEQNILNRERMLNPPRSKWFVQQTVKGNLPLIRDEKIDNSIHLDFEVPKDVKDRDCAKWITDNTDRLVKKWGDYEGR